MVVVTRWNKTNYSNFCVARNPIHLTPIQSTAIHCQKYGTTKCLIASCCRRSPSFVTTATSSQPSRQIPQNNEKKAKQLRWNELCQSWQTDDSILTGVSQGLTSRSSSQSVSFQLTVIAQRLHVCRRSLNGRTIRCICCHMRTNHQRIIHGVKWRHRIYGHDTIAILWV